MPQLGVGELVVILVIVVAIFGVGKLPQLGGALGRTMREFREASAEGEPMEESTESEGSQA